VLGLCIFLCSRQDGACGAVSSAGELFDFDAEVEPLLEVLVGKVLEQSLMEVLEEEELAAMKAHQVRGSGSHRGSYRPLEPHCLNCTDKINLVKRAWQAGVQGVATRGVIGP
jgi:hypothetical protein